MSATPDTPPDVSFKEKVEIVEEKLSKKKPRRHSKQKTSCCLSCCIQCEEVIKKSIIGILLLLATFTSVWPTLIAAIYYYIKPSATKNNAYKIVFVGHLLRIFIMALVQIPEKLAQM